MSATSPIRTDRVTAWLDEHVDGISGPYDFKLITGGPIQPHLPGDKWGG